MARNGIAIASVGCGDVGECVRCRCSGGGESRVVVEGIGVELEVAESGEMVAGSGRIAVAGNSVGSAKAIEVKDDVAKGTDDRN